MPDISVPSDAASLGALRATYGPVARRVKAGRTLGLFFIGLGVIAVAGGVALALTGGANWLTLSIIGLALAAFGVWAMRSSKAYASLRVALHEEGLLYAIGGKEQTYRWDELAEVRQDVMVDDDSSSSQTHYAYHLVAQDGRRLTLDGRVRDIIKLGQALQQAALPSLLKAALARYAQGETLDFGKLSASRDGLTQGRRTLAWGDVVSAQLDGEGEYLSITQVGRKVAWARLRTRKVPNLYVLLALVQQQKGGEL